MRSRQRRGLAELRSELNTSSGDRDGGRERQGTSAIYSPRLQRNIGFAWLPVERSTLGERVTVETEWGARTGTVVEMPFVDPSKQIPVS